MSAHVCSCCISAYVEEVRKCFKEAYAETRLQTNSEADWQKWYYDRVTSTVQLRPGDIVLIKLDTFHDKKKVKDWWSKAEYVVVCQVADDVPAYNVQDDGGNAKVIHCNQHFLVATPRGDAMLLGASKVASEDGTTQSALAELTPLERDEALTRWLTSYVLLGWMMRCH